MLLSPRTGSRSPQAERTAFVPAEAICFPWSTARALEVAPPGLKSHPAGADTDCGILSWPRGDLTRLRGSAH